MLKVARDRPESQYRMWALSRSRIVELISENHQKLNILPIQQNDSFKLVGIILTRRENTAERRQY